MTTLEMLKRARALVEKPGTWCQRANARDKDGYPVDIESEAATMFCVFGAFNRVYYEATTVLLRKGVETTDPKMKAVENAYVKAKNTFIAMARKRFGAAERLGIATFNDHSQRTRKQIVLTFDDSIREAEVSP